MVNCKALGTSNFIGATWPVYFAILLSLSSNGYSVYKLFGIRDKLIISLVPKLYSTEIYLCCLNHPGKVKKTRLSSHYYLGGKMTYKVA